ncbi:MAG TPA: phenylalanine--tRNA ligase subunit beta [Candidatus Limnocylindria bacterium]|nr:phenylalanine--tRNA ligase subunit beta [Candidatus Limnocylindria bacterium]
MKISLNWVKQFTDIDLSVDELVTKIGAQLGAVEEVIDLGAKYKDVVIAQIVEKKDHPNADKLAIYQAQVGREELVQVVCGDKNLQVGDKVAWIQPGAVVPSTHDKEPFTMEARPLRGEVSNGMFGSGAELLLNDNHGRVVALDTPADPGTLFADAYELNDFIVDIENKMFTHRPDCFGILGVAREIAGIQNSAFKSPDWYLKSLDRVKPGKTKLPLDVRNQAGELVPRFMAVAMADVKMGDSPLIIQSYLSRVGLKSINNIVDVTNYLMILTGQPLHAYDYDKVKERSGDMPVLIARKAGAKEKIRLLNGKEIAFDDPAILIATDKEPIGVGGIMGGADTEVDENTKNIILECANFDMYSIRRTAMKYGLFTDAVTRFNKGQSPLQNDIVLEEAVATVQYVSGAHVASDVFDVKTQLQKPAPVKVTNGFINVRLGLDLPAEDMARLLENVEFMVDVHGDELSTAPPFWRTDIEIPEDIVEEVGRLYGFDHLPVVLPKRTIKPAQKDNLLDLKTRIRDVLAKAGANEVLTYSFVHGNLLDRVGQDKTKAFELSNALSPDLQYYRLSLTPSLLEKIHPNIKAGYDEFAIFEIGKVHIKGLLDDKNGENVPRELNRIALVFAASPKAQKSYQGAAYYQANTYLHKVLNTFVGQGALTMKPLHEADFGEHLLIQQMTTPYNPERAAVLVKNDLVVGVVGEYRTDVARSLKLPAYTAGFEIFHSFLMADPAELYTPISKFPKVEQDISLKVSGDQPYQPLFDELLAGLHELSDENLKTSLMPLDIYKKDGNKHFTFRLSAAHYGKTLKAAEINQLLDKLADRAKQKFNAERI